MRDDGSGMENGGERPARKHRRPIDLPNQDLSCGVLLERDVARSLPAEEHRVAARFVRDPVEALDWPFGLHVQRAVEDKELLVAARGAVGAKHREDVALFAGVIPYFRRRRE